MMKLSNLNDDREKAMEILKKWNFSAPNYDLMDQFRLSATSIYPFQDGDDILLLRYSPSDERDLSFIKAELDFMTYLDSKGLHVAKVKTSADDNAIESLNDGYISYFASVFHRVKGQRVDRIELSDSLLYKLGETLADFHNMSQAYVPDETSKRPNYEWKLSWIESLLKENSSETLSHEKALKELETLRSELSELPKSDDNYGLIHYDYDLDNLFFDEASDAVSVIDFDDAIYHWYFMDVLNFHESLEDEFEGQDLDQKKKCFDAGYASKRSIDTKTMEKAQTLKRYSSLVSYAVCLYSTSEMPSDPPEWMLNLKQKLENKMQSIQNGFEI